jgi:FtsZ-interacting cell division protein YlmF
MPAYNDWAREPDARRCSFFVWDQQKQKTKKQKTKKRKQKKKKKKKQKTKKQKENQKNKNKKLPKKRKKNKKKKMTDWSLVCVLLPRLFPLVSWRRPKAPSRTQTEPR